MTQLVLDLASPSSSPPATPAPQPTGTVAPAEWEPTPAALPEPGARLVDRHGRTATVEAVREEGIDIRLDQPSNFGRSNFCGLYPPTWWRDWRKA